MINFSGKKIAIIGGTGTLGRALMNEIIASFSEIEQVIIFSRDEIKQLEMMEDYPPTAYPFLEFKLGDVRDLPRLQEVLSGVHYVIHAAALKHVVMAEKNPDECWKTNVVGTQNVVAACKANEVETVVLASTDKAYKPIGVYGKSKAAAEDAFLAASVEGAIQFRVVRLGNIIGARGSVFEAFEKQKKTGVLKVTHPDATRFCITQGDAARFVLDALQSNKPEILTPEMRSFHVMELAKEIAPNCEIQIVGLRPGDKLHEELADVNSKQLLNQLS